MMSRLQKWEEKIKAKRSRNTFRSFVQEIPSWIPVILNKNQGQLSRYPQTDRIFNLTEPQVYEDSRDIFLSKWAEYDFSRTFFENYLELKKRMPLLSALVYENSENSGYAEGVWMSKNVYLSFIVIENCENILYTFYTQDNVKNTLNSVMVWDNSENVYFWAGIIQGFNVFYSKYIVNSSNIWFSTNLVGCQECMFCDGLENQSYCIRNVVLEKERYFEEKKKILQNKSAFLGYYDDLNPDGMNLWSSNVDGKFCIFSKNIKDGYFNYRLENGKNVVFVWDKDGRKNVMDTVCSDQTGLGDIYACSNLGTSENVYCCDCIIWQSLYYCFDCLSCSFCLGCVWLKNKSYCILNKQYTKEEWYSLADRIFAQMDADGTLGDFFPWSMNPFYFNDTMAYLIDDSFTKEEVEKEWYLWRDEAIKVDIPEGADVVYTSSRPSEALTPDPSSSSADLRPKGERGEKRNLQDYQWYDTDGNWTIQEDILKKVIRDEKGNFYKIVPMELEFLQKHNLPLPEIHWLERIKMGFRM